MKIQQNGFAIEFVEKKKKNMQNYTLIEGFPGAGLVGTISSKFLVEKMGFEKIGFVHSNAFIPIIRIHKGKPIRPIRIYINDKLKIVALVSEQIIPTLIVDRLAKSLVSWAEEKGIKRVISLAGIKNAEGSKEKIYGISCCAKETDDLLKKHNVELIEEGITTGVSAMILLELQENTKIDGYSLLGNVRIGADYEAAANVLEKLDEILGLELDTEPLMKEAKETEKALLKQLEQIKQTNKNVEQMQGNIPRTPMYT